MENIAVNDESNTLKRSMCSLLDYGNVISTEKNVYLSAPQARTSHASDFDWEVFVPYRNLIVEGMQRIQVMVNALFVSENFLNKRPPPWNRSNEPKKSQFRGMDSKFESRAIHDLAVF